MEYVQLGTTAKTVSRIGFGGCPLGGHDWGATDDAELRRALVYAVDHGVTLYDTADVYGLGESERILGEELAGRDDLLIATKFGVRRINDQTIYDNSPAWIEEALEGSLRRLRREAVDVYQLHYWDGRTPFVEILDTVDRLRRRGKLQFFGVTNIAIEEHVDAPLPPWVVSFSYECSLLKRQHSKSIDHLGRECGLTFLSWGSLAQGSLSGKYPPDHRFGSDDRRSREVYGAFHGDGLRRREATLALMREVLVGYPGRTLSQLAIRWILDRYQGSVALVGVKRTAQIEDMITATGWMLSQADVVRLDALLGSFENPNNARSRIPEIDEEIV